MIFGLLSVAGAALLVVIDQLIKKTSILAIIKQESLSWIVDNDRRIV